MPRYKVTVYIEVDAESGHAAYDDVVSIIHGEHVLSSLGDNIEVSRYIEEVEPADQGTFVVTPAGIAYLSSVNPQE